MKYVITGSLGNISQPLTKKLVSAGHNVTVVSSQESRKAEIEALGAKAAIGSVQDLAFLTETFTGADAAYIMVPPTFSATNWKAYIGDTGKIYAQAIKAAGLKHIVNLSSIGAHMPEGCGPVSGLHFEETALNTLTDVHIKHLRPGNFFTNLYTNIGMIKHNGIIGANYGNNTTIIFAYPADIADVAAEELLTLSFKNHSIRYVVSDERTTSEVAKVLGTAIGKPELPWIDFTDADSYAGMTGAGLPEEVAKNYVEMGKALREGTMFADYNTHKASVKKSKTKLEEFAKEFAAAYNK